MNWEHTQASQCRYGEVAGNIFWDADIIWENSNADWQGFANLLASMTDGTFVHYSWTYGSCSGCDEWEARGLSEEEIEEEMRSGFAELGGRQELMAYLHLEEDRSIPSANSSTNGSIPGMLKLLSGGYSDDFEEMRKKTIEWLQNNPE
jgi:hypothetical protein